MQQREEDELLMQHWAGACRQPAASHGPSAGLKMLWRLAAAMPQRLHAVSTEHSMQARGTTRCRARVVSQGPASPTSVSSMYSVIVASLLKVLSACISQGSSTRCTWATAGSSADWSTCTMADGRCTIRTRPGTSTRPGRRRKPRDRQDLPPQRTHAAAAVQQSVLRQSTTCLEAVAGEGAPQLMLVVCIAGPRSTTKGIGGRQAGP